MCGYINTFIYTKQQEREREKPGGFLAHIVPLKPFCSFSSSFFLSLSTFIHISSPSAGREREKERRRTKQ
jgi:hypothetical protein